MAFAEIQWRPTPRQLRQFGATALVCLPLLGWLWGAPGATGGMLAVIGALTAALGAARPALLRPAFVALSVATFPIGLVVGELLLALIFFGMVWPLAAAFRVIRRDALQLRSDRAKATYWERKRRPAGLASYLRMS